MKGLVSVLLSHTSTTLHDFAIELSAHDCGVIFVGSTLQTTVVSYFTMACSLDFFSSR